MTEPPKGPAAPRSRRTLRALGDDLAGGFSATLIAVPQAMSLGILVFAALGPEYASIGVAAALLTSVIGNLVSAGIPAVRCQIVGARASTTAVVAGFTSVLLAHPALQAARGPDIQIVIALVFLTILLAGVFQVGFGLAGLGRSIKFVPYPVVAGFMTGVALIILASQVRPLLGLDGSGSLIASLAEIGNAKPASPLVAVAAVLAAWAAPRFTRRVPPLFCGLLAGVSLHYVAAALFPSSTGPVVGVLSSMVPLPDEAAAILGLMHRDNFYALFVFILPTALLLAIVGSLDGLLAAVVVDSVTRSRHDSNRLLVGQGVASIFSAGFGALPAVGNTHTPIANFQAGGRTPFSTLFHAFFVFMVTFALQPLVARVPIAALAGLMIYIAFSLVDRWTRDLIGRLLTDHEHRGEILVNVAIVLGVAFAQLLFNVMVAFAIGVVAAVTLLLVKISGSPVRRHVDGTERASLKVRGAEACAALRPIVNQIQILELQGELFFGTTDRLQEQVEALPEDSQYVILDFRRVNEIDASGARMLEVIGHRAARRGVRVLLSHIRDDEPRGKYLRALGIGAVVGPNHWFTDLDRALEWAEDRLLDKVGFREDLAELPPGRMALFRGLDEREIATLAGFLERRELRSGEPVFQEGDDGDCLYLIARGSVSIKIKLGDGTRARRLATFTSGVMFGEMSLLEGSKRSADAYAKGENVVLFSLHAERFRALVRDDPDLGLKVFRSISTELASRLRATTAAMRTFD
ncbi:MAG: SulP family inorganic anion transporter [Usitatibacter sp.]